MNNELLWYTGRGTGLIALVLLTVVLVLGVVGRSGRPALGLTRFALADVHRNASLMALGLVLIHLTVLWMDPYARLRIFDLLIPFDAAYRPFWVGLGTIAMELLVVTVVTSLLRRRIGARTWKLLHWASYGLWPIAWLHGWFTGTDAGKWWFRLIAITCLLAGVAAVAWRCTPQFLEIPRPRFVPPVQPVPVAPSSGPSLALREPSGAHRVIRGRTGAHPVVPPPLTEPSGAHHVVPGPFGGYPGGRGPGFAGPPGPHTGSQPRIRDHTGSQPRIRDTGSLPRFPDTGSQPRFTDTGSQPRFTDTGSMPRFSDRGSPPRGRDHTGSQPAVRGDQPYDELFGDAPSSGRHASPDPGPNWSQEDWFR